MLRKLALHVRGNVVAYLALFFALGGTSAYAANEWNSSNIQDNTLQSRDLKDNAGVTSRDVVNDSVAGGGLVGGDIRANVLTGADIRESTLGKVPDADKLDGKDSSAFASGDEIDSSGLVAIDDATAGDGVSTPTQTLASNATFKMVGKCTDIDGGRRSGSLWIQTNADDSRVGKDPSPSQLDVEIDSGGETMLVVGTTPSPITDLNRIAFSAVAPNGDTLQGHGVAGSHYAGRHCAFAVDASG